MISKGQSAVFVAVLALALMALTPGVQAQDASSSQPGSASGSDSSGQVLEIPQAVPSPSAESGGSSSSGSTLGETWSDGTNTYTWQNQSPDSDQQSSSQDQASDPNYAGVDQYLDQQAQAEAMYPGFSPIFGAPVPLLLNPFYLYGGYPVQTLPAPAPVVPQPVPRPAPRGPGVGGWHLFGGGSHFAGGGFHGSPFHGGFHGGGFHGGGFHGR